MDLYGVINVMVLPETRSNVKIISKVLKYFWSLYKYLIFKVWTNEGVQKNTTPLSTYNK